MIHASRDELRDHRERGGRDEKCHRRGTTTEHHARSADHGDQEQQEVQRWNERRRQRLGLRAEVVMQEADLPVQLPLEQRHPVADRHNEAGLFRQRDELHGRDQPLLRREPADQHFSAEDLALIVHLRLKIQFELTFGEGMPQIGLQLQSRLQCSLHGRIVEPQGIATAVLRLVHGVVGALHQRLHHRRGRCVRRDRRLACAQAATGQWRRTNRRPYHGQVVRARRAGGQPGPRRPHHRPGPVVPALRDRCHPPGPRAHRQWRVC